MNHHLISISIDILKQELKKKDSPEKIKIALKALDVLGPRSLNMLNINQRE